MNFKLRVVLFLLLACLIFQYTKQRYVRDADPPPFDLEIENLPDGRTKLTHNGTTDTIEAGQEYFDSRMFRELAQKQLEFEQNPEQEYLFVQHAVIFLLLSYALAYIIFRRPRLSDD